MKSVVGAFGTMILLLLNVLMCITISNASVAVAVAKEYKADVVAEIENSNFNPYVIEGCIRQAELAGYNLQITNYTYDDMHDVQTAEVILTYAYELPMFGIYETKTTRGIAR